MELNTIHPAVGSKQKKRRIGRGPGSGKGGTSTRGHKGAKSRSGYKTKIGFEGVDAPPAPSPQFGFKNINRVEHKAINLSDIETLAAARNLEKIGLEELPRRGFHLQRTARQDTRQRVP